MKRLRSLLFVAVLTVNFSLGDPVQNSGPAIKRTTLTNGLTVILVEKHQLPMVEGLLVVKSGALADPKAKEGLATLVCNLLTKGNFESNPGKTSRAKSMRRAAIFKPEWIGIRLGYLSTF